MAGGAEALAEDGTALPRRLAEDAHAYVLGLILSGALAGGAIVQERKLALALGVSRSPMRDALGRLEGEGLLVRRSERLLGVRVVTLQDYLDALEVRALLEPQAAMLAAAQIGAAELAALEAGQAALEADREAPAEAHWAFDERLHGAIAAASRNPLLARTILDMRRITTIFERQSTPFGLRPGTRGHRRLLDALQGRRPDHVGQAMQQHIAEVRRNALAGF